MPENKVRLCRYLVWLSYVVLLLQQGMDLWVREAPGFIALALMIPLLVFIPGLVADKLRSYIWLCFVLLLYFMRLVLALFAQPDNTLAIVGMVAVVTLFIAAMMYVRWRARELRDAAVQSSGHEVGREIE